MSLLYDTSAIYDTAYWTYDGDFVGAIDFKATLYRELQAVLDGLVLTDHIQLDMRLSPEIGSTWVIFRRITESQVNNIGYVRERWEIEIITPRGQDSTLDAVRTSLIDAFAGMFRTIGVYSADGELIGEGMRVKGHHISTIENFDETLEEKSSLLIFAFFYLG